MSIEKAKNWTLLATLAAVVINAAFAGIGILILPTNLSDPNHLVTQIRLLALIGGCCTFGCLLQYIKSGCTLTLRRSAH